ncbi:major facilitator superfamily domain-containing protein [Mycena floridula]|nr:major facilitator superfamily domain-containing protein [Mycena floridula]
MSTTGQSSTNVEDLSTALASGSTAQETTELLIDPDFVRSHHHETEETLLDEPEFDEELAHRKQLPWWKRPSPVWILVAFPFSSLAFSSIIAPKVELYTQLACLVHRPDIFDNSTMLLPSLSNSTYLTRSEITVQLPEYNRTPHISESTPPECSTDPAVAAAASKLIAIMATVMGILGCLTTGWWGSFSDRHGRTTVLFLAVTGLMFADWNFILVAKFYDKLPGGYWFLILSSIVEGCLGSLVSASAASHAYMADTTTPGTRSRTFSMALGLMFVGFACGPTLGGLLIKYTGNILSVFYFAATAHTVYALFMFFVIPESLTRAQMRKSATKYADEHLEMARTRAQQGFFARLSPLLSFLTPLAIFSPTMGSNRLKGRARDWNLICIAIAYGCAVSLVGSFPYLVQYTSMKFNWTPETMGYYLSAIGASRAFHLTILLPLMIRLFQGKSRPADENLSRSRSPSTPRPKVHSPRFDLRMSIGSLIVEVVVYIFFISTSSSAVFFTLGIVTSLGAGLPPAVQALALELYMRKGGIESGRLFGAMSVVQSLSSQIIAPSVYGLVFMNTVATFPKAFMLVSLGSLMLALFLLCLVRIPKTGAIALPEHPEDLEPGSHGHEATLVSAEEGTPGK